MKVLVSLLIVFGATQVMAKTLRAKPLLNGITYDVHEACFDGSNLVAMVTKSRDLIQDDDGKDVVVGQVTISAGDAFPWKNATATIDDDGKDKVVNFTRNGRPSVTVIEFDSNDDDAREVSRTYVAFPYCQ